MVNFFPNLVIFFFLSSLSLGSSLDCRKSYERKEPLVSISSLKRISPGPFPEFMPIGTVLLAYFTDQKYFIDMHKTIIDGLPQEVQAETLVSKNDMLGNPFGSIVTEQYYDKMKSSLEKRKLKITELPVDEEFHPGQHGNWIRDFMSPLAITKNGKLAFINVNYFRSMADKTDFEARKIFIKRILKETNLEVIEVDMPFYFEWGNWENDGKGNFFVSKRVVETNKDNPDFLKYQDGQLINGFEVWMKKYFGEKINIIWNDPLPLEDTGHNDLLFKFVNSETAIVASSAHKENKIILDTIAKNLQELGKKVIRVPLAESTKETQMTLPLYSVRSYANSLIVNGVAFVPKYSNDDGSFENYDNNAKKLFEALGFKVVQVPSRESIADKGAVHCITCTLPNIKEILNKLKER